MEQKQSAMLPVKSAMLPVSETLFIPLRQRAEAALWHPRFRDPMAEKWWKALPDIIDFPILHTPLAAMKKIAVTRSEGIDQQIRSLARNTRLKTVIELGAGLSTRPYRLQDLGLEFVLVDFPEVIALRAQMEAGSKKISLLGEDILDWNFVGGDLPFAPSETLIVAEGLLHYFSPEDVHELVRKLKNRFSGAYFLADYYASWVTPLMKAKLDENKKVPLRFGLAHAEALGFRQVLQQHSLLEDLGSYASPKQNLLAKVFSTALKLNWVQKLYQLALWKI